MNMCISFNFKKQLYVHHDNDVIQVQNLSIV